MKMPMNERLKFALKAQKVTQKELANMINVGQPSISGFCTGDTKPSQRTIRDICNALDINEDWLTSGIGEMERATPESVIAKLIEEYRLEPYAARVVNAFARAVKVLNEAQLRALVDSIMRELQEDQPDSAPVNMIRIRRYSDPAAAGSPLWAESDYDEIEYPADIVPYKTDFAVRISGASMEPTIKDGATAFVRRAERPADGDIVIAWIDGEGTVCKRVKAKSNGTLTALVSDNTAFPSIEGDKLKNVRFYGIVVGQVEAGDPRVKAKP